MNPIAQLAVPREPKTSYASIEQMLWNERHQNEAIRLHCNETPFDLPQELKQQLATKMIDLSWNCYPDFYNAKLTALIAQQAGVQPENVVLGNGSSSLIQQVVNCCAKFLSVAIIEHPTFTFYHQVCQNERLPYQQWILKENNIYNLSTFPAVVEPALVVLTSPNNPTGAILPSGILQTLLEQYPQHIFVIDEAYGEFGGESAVGLVNKYPNLLVIKTLSKGFGLPSIRFGYAVGSAPLMQLLKKYTVPFTINIFTEMVVCEVLTNPDIMNALRVHQERIKNLRDFVGCQLRDMSGLFTVQPSAANFLLLRFQNEELLEDIKQALRSHNILVGYPMPQCLRLTIGTETQMSQVLRLIRGALTPYKNRIQSEAEVLY